MIRIINSTGALKHKYLNRFSVSRLVDICKFCKLPPSHFFHLLMTDDASVHENIGEGFGHECKTKVFSKDVFDENTEIKS